MKEIKNIVIIGAGNVATQLGYALDEAGLQILQVYSRSHNSAKILADDLYTDFTTDLLLINEDADLYIISISDNALTEIANQLKVKDKLVVHTSGSVDMKLLEKVSENYGVFYPLQTFSKLRKTEFGSIPICLEASSEEQLLRLEYLARKLTSNIQKVNSERRKILHLAAVFACNFPNYMYNIAARIIEDADFSFDILRPLIKETTEKIMKIDPAEAQTGPAKRGDKNILDKHLHMLENMPEYRQLYSDISAEIRKDTKKIQTDK